MNNDDILKSTSARALGQRRGWAWACFARALAGSDSRVGVGTFCKGAGSEARVDVGTWGSGVLSSFLRSNLCCFGSLVFFQYLTTRLKVPAGVAAAGLFSLIIYLI